MKTMFKKVVPLFLAVILCVSLAAPAFAAAPDDEVAGINSTLHYYIVTAPSGANMRYGAGTSYGVVATYSQGTYLYYAGNYAVSSIDGYMWLYLGYYSTTGWVRADLVQYVGPYTY